MTSEERTVFMEYLTYWALYASDEYVWLFYEKPLFHGDRIERKKLMPPGIVEALRSARDKVNAGKPLGFDMDPIFKEAAIRKERGKQEK